MKQYEENRTIKTWSEEDRPREKLIQKGRTALTDAELIAILLGSGTRNLSAVGLARSILDQCNRNLHELARKNVAELSRTKGIGSAKAVRLVAALELGRRRQSSEVKERALIRSSNDAFSILHPIIGDLGHEEFWTILLNRANKILAVERISSGGMTGTVADIRMIFRKAIENHACSIIISHNHPSGNLHPSEADRELTRKVSQAGETMDIRVLDHVIITQGSYVSFADEGWM